MNWTLPMARVNGTVRRSHGRQSIGSPFSRSRSRINQPPTAIARPVPNRAPAMPPAAWPPRIRMIQTMAKRPTPSSTSTQPSPKKFCRP